MKFITGLSIQQIDTILPSTFVKFSSTIGLEHIEFDKSVFSDINNVLKLLKVKQTTIHAPYREDYGFDLSTRNDEADQFVNHVIKTRNSLKIKAVIVHPPTDTNGSMDLFYDRLDKLPLPLLENMPNQSWKEFSDFYENTKANIRYKIGICFDIPHSYITNSSEFLNLPIWCIEILKTSYGYIHISGGTKTNDTHYPLLTEGDIPLNLVKQFLLKINFSGTITMELAPRKLEEVEKIIQSYIIMLGLSGKRIHKLKVKIKRRFIMRKVHELSKKTGLKNLRRSEC